MNTEEFIKENELMDLRVVTPIVAQRKPKVSDKDKQEFRAFMQKHPQLVDEVVDLLSDDAEDDAYKPAAEDFRLPKFKLTDDMKIRMAKKLGSQHGQQITEIISLCKYRFCCDWIGVRKATWRGAEDMRGFFTLRIQKASPILKGDKLLQRVDARLKKWMAEQTYPVADHDKKMQWWRKGLSRQPAFGCGDADLIRDCITAVKRWMVEEFGPEIRNDEKDLLSFGKNLVIDKKNHAKSVDVRW